ncbi:MAG TPA: hypothetical protein VLG37_04265 [Candidatus Saccharimonadales bacterium]|nr:hypothetical protein [Candidatus Saccharimonadales bacterium]
MQKIKRLSLILPVLTMALALTQGMPAVAHGEEDSSNRGSGTTSSETEIHTASTQTGVNESDQENSRTQAAAMLEKLREQHKSNKTAEERTKVCEAHKQGLETKFTNISKNAEAYQARIDAILAKAETYKADHNLTITNWDTLLAAAKQAQTASAASIANLKSLTPSLDCNNVSVAQDVATFKVAAQQTRDDLKAYKMAVKTVLKALLGAKQVDNKATTEGSEQ